MTKLEAIQNDILQTSKEIDALRAKYKQLREEMFRIKQEEASAKRLEAESKRAETVKWINMPGVGTELHKLLLRFRIRPRPGCKCTERQIAMNQNGIEWCEQNIDTIVGWMIEEAEERGRLQEAAARVFAEKLVRIAIYKAKKRM